MKLRNTEKFALVDRMATAIARVMKQNDTCRPADLDGTEFTPEQIANNWNLAKALAHVELNMMDS